MKKRGTNKLVSPILKWAGGKKQLLPEIEMYSAPSPDFSKVTSPIEFASITSSSTNTDSLELQLIVCVKRFTVTVKLEDVTSLY